MRLGAGAVGLAEELVVGGDVGVEDANEEMSRSRTGEKV